MVIMNNSTHLPRVAILLANTGGGHRSAARSLAEAYEGKAQVSFINLLDDYLPFPFNTFSPTYGPWVNYAPWLYHAVYKLGASRRRIELSERAVYPFVKRKVAEPLMAVQPDLVVSVHPLQVDVPLQVLRTLGNPAPFVTVVTDPVSAPVAWFCPQVDLCVVATEPARRIALECGVPPERVRVIGLPIRRAFGIARDRPKALARVRLGLDPHKPLVLMSGGGAGIGRLMPMARAITQQLAKAGTPAQMAIIAGHNRVLMRQLRAQSWPVPVTILGFIEEMADWLAASDLLITKAGPGTLAEAACMGVPVIITSYIPGQEIGNVRWIEQHGAGIFAREPRRVAGLVEEWLRPGHPTLGQMALQARAMAQCDAADRIVEATLELVSRPGQPPPWGHENHKPLLSFLARAEKTK